ncbi:hypothetical protein, partial [Staphylococcus pasteuri_A]
MAAKGGDWGIVAVYLRTPPPPDQMQPQGGAYTSVTLGADGNTAKVIHAITDVLVAPEDPDAVLAAMADPAVK